MLLLGAAQRIGSAIGIAAIGTVLFGTLDLTSGPNAAVLAFIHSAAYAMGVSIILALIAFALVFALPHSVVSRAPNQSVPSLRRSSATDTRT